MPAAGVTPRHIQEGTMKGKRRPLYLFVWEGVLCDYTPGIMFALAHDVDHARRVITKKAAGLSSVVSDLKGEPVRYTRAAGFYEYGGG
jgi:hypothetical protein